MNEESLKKAEAISLARAAKLAGAPRAPEAGIEFLAPLGSVMERGQPLFILHAAARGVLDYALEYIGSQAAIVTLGDR